MGKFDSVDAELLALSGSEGAVTRALDSARVTKPRTLEDADAALASLGDGSASRPVPSAAFDAEALFEDVGSRPSMMAPMDMDVGASPAPMPDLAPSAAGDLAGLLEGSNSLLPPASDEASEPVAMPISVATPLHVEEEYEEMRLASVEIEDEPQSTEIEILED